METICLNKVNSTNLFANELISNKKVSKNTLIYTYSQEKGKGMGNNSWFSEDNKNLIFSLILFNKFKAASHFNISIITSLAICDYLSFKGVNSQIKWPNDILYKNKKLCGILIENSIMGEFINSSIIGIGLNLNQEIFSKNLTSAISLKNILNKYFNIDIEVKTLANNIEFYFNEFKDKSFEFLKNLYLQNLYKYNEFSQFQSKNGIFSGKIIDIDFNGYLYLDINSQLEKFYFKEIEFIESI